MTKFMTSSEACGSDGVPTARAERPGGGGNAAGMTAAPHREDLVLSKRTRLMAIDKAKIDPRCAELALAVQSDAALLPFAESSFDAVFIRDVLQHIEADDVVVREIRRVLRPGGSLLTTSTSARLYWEGSR